MSERESRRTGDRAGEALVSTAYTHNFPYRWTVTVTLIVHDEVSGLTASRVVLIRKGWGLSHTRSAQRFDLAEAEAIEYASL